MQADHFQLRAPQWGQMTVTAFHDGLAQNARPQLEHLCTSV
jgi:hypothetical protein